MQDSDAITEAAVEFIYDGYVAPLSKLERQKHKIGEFNGGAYYADGSVCDRSVQIKFFFQNIPSPLVPDDSIPYLSGSHIFCGMLQDWHFGHFIVESLTRLWAIKEIGDKYDSLLFYTRFPGKKVPRFATEVLHVLGWTKPVNIIREVTKVEHLAVPSSLSHAKMGYLYGHPAVRRLFADSAKVRKLGYEKVYVSRSKLNVNDGVILMESCIEKSLEAEGYVVIHPQEYSIEDQLAIYSSADMLVFSEGSPIHLYAYVSRPDQRVYIIWRRRVIPMFGWQLTSFNGPKLQGKPVIIGLWAPKANEVSDPRQKAKTVLDFEKLKEDMVKCGFIAGNDWVTPSPDEMALELDRIRANSKYTYEYHAADDK